MNHNEQYIGDNRCSEKALRYMQIALMVKEEGGLARTTNLCQRCYNEKLVQQGKQSLKSKEWKEVLVKMAHRGRLWKVFGSEQFLLGMWEYFTLKRAWARKILADAAHEKQEGMQGQWRHEFSFQRSSGASQKEVRIQIAVPRQCAVRAPQ